MSILFAGFIALPIANAVLSFPYLMTLNILYAIKTVFIESLLIILLAGIWASVPVFLALLIFVLIRPGVFARHPFKTAAGFAVLVGVLFALNTVPMDDPLITDLTLSQRFYDGATSLMPWIITVSTFVGAASLGRKLEDIS
ncbi:hypothetical protein [Parasulfitobacter algicola]|uniref:Branched-chain amino acid transport system carrier protein n=1 Tax=Parasulfitobacter algicola TaxID=2614809 RepID=A0ABX2IU03_9RHOB|nr:hypothetical protein [Sulfitobacter algicola]NSX56374.1 hypothetical protein [Sulfitobacter algicola]